MGQIPGTHGRPALKVRIVALRQSPQAAAKARRTTRQETRDPGYPVAQETLDAAEFLELYRLRWPIGVSS